MNTLCLAALNSRPAEGGTGDEARGVPVQRIRDLVGGSLVGVLLSGSAARGERRGHSDADLLIVVDPEVPLVRTLYERWDEVIGHDTPLSPHFVHIPDDIGKAGSTWCDAAVDSTVSFDRDGDLARFFGALRGSMAEGRIRRTSAYGHPCWIHAPQEAERFRDDLAGDYLRRAGSRLRALDALMEERSWADVVREAQEIVEITFKALLRSCHIEVPQVHDASPVLLDNRERLPRQIDDRLDELVNISRSLRRDRELAFYGSEDLTPSEFYREEDAATARGQARLVHEVIVQGLGR